MSNSEVTLTDPETGRSKKLDVSVQKKDEDAESNAEETLKKIALMEWDKHIEKLVEQHPEFEERIRETEPTQIEKLEIEMLKDAQRTGRKMSAGVVGLRQDGSDDPVEAVFTGEYNTQLDMINALKKLKQNKNLTPTQHRRILDAEDTLWAGVKNQPIRNTVITEKTKYDGKHVFLVKCHVCYEEIPQRDFNVHMESHKGNPVKNMFDKIKEYRGK